MMSATEIQKFLTGMEYPTPKAELIRQADEQNAPQEVKAVLKDLPDREYQGAFEVNRALERME